MLSNVSPSLTVRFSSVNRQTENRTRNENKSFSPGVSDKIEISHKAKANSKAMQNQAEALDTVDDTFEKILAEYRNMGVVSRSDEPDNSAATEARRKLVAMRIAMRISKGDNVPMQDHRYLAEYDAKLYKAALRASMVADNDDPEDHDSLVDEMLAAEQAEAESRSQGAKPQADGLIENTIDIIVDDADVTADEV
jgi:hypothetical protein